MLWELVVLLVTALAGSVVVERCGDFSSET